MNIIIPMAGQGSRFLNVGYKLPKFMIEVNNYTLFEYSISSLPLTLANKIIFICLKKHNKEFDVHNFIHQKLSQFGLNKLLVDIIYLDEVSKGQADTVFYSENLVDMEKDLLIYNIDTSFISKNLNEILINNSKKRDGVLGVFNSPSNDDKWSFAQIDEDGIVTKTTEKVKISDYASTGLYHFTKASDFYSFKYQDQVFSNLSERYIAPLYNNLINQGKKFVIDIVDKFIPLGTPSEVEQAKKYMV